MAKKQTRRTVSLNSTVFDYAKAAAKEEGVPLSDWVTRQIRKELPGIPAVVNGSVAALHAYREKGRETFRKNAPARKAAALAAKEAGRLATYVPNATPAPPRSIAAIGPAVTLGTCAICVNRPADRMADLDGVEYAVCNNCATERGNSGRYSYGSGFSPGAPSLALSSGRKR